MENELVVRAAVPALRRHTERHCGYAERTPEPARQREPPSTGVLFSFGLGPSRYERAKAAGAKITWEIEDTPYDGREYTAKGPEGHVWSFGTCRPKVGA